MCRPVEWNDGAFSSAPRQGTPKIVGTSIIYQYPIPIGIKKEGCILNCRKRDFSFRLPSARAAPFAPFEMTVAGKVYGEGRNGGKAAVSSLPFFLHEISCHSERSEEPRRARRRQSFSFATI